MRRALAIAASALAALLLQASPALGAFGFEDFDVTYEKEGGAAATQAGSHPFAMTTAFKANTFTDSEGREFPEGETKDIVLRQVEGLAGNPTAVPQCPSATFIDLEPGTAESKCPDSTAVGIAALRAEFEPAKASDTGFLHVPVFNLEPPKGVAAKLGFIVLREPVTVEVRVAEEYPNNIVARLTNVPQVLLFYSSKVTLWGNPASPVHDALRGSCVDNLTAPTSGPTSKGLCPAGVPEKPFLTLPRSCQGPLTTTLDATSWDGQPAVSETAVSEAMDECETLEFEPTVDAAATSAEASSPSGLDFAIEVDDPGLSAPGGRAHSDLREVRVTLPEGVTANPSAAEGLGACSAAQLEASTPTAAGCPAASKLGTLEVETPILENRVLQGEVFLATPDDPATAQPRAENPFDALLALYMVIREPELGIVVTQAARVEPDPLTGRLTTTVTDIPQFPLSRIELSLRGGPRAPLVTPPSCGTHTTLAELTSWSGKTIEETASFTTTSGPGGSPCPAGTPPFSPAFEAGTLDNAAGSFSPLYMRLARNDSEQELTRVSALLPQGLSGKIAGVARCPEEAIAAAAQKGGRLELAFPSCPASSRIGRVLAGAGAGPQLTYVPGQVYLAGPYAGDPMSIVVITPAVTGPFDIGTVVIREGLELDPVTAQVIVDGSAAAPIPRILEGIPLRLRDLRVHVDRPELTLNATSCEPKSVLGTLFGSAADPFTSADDGPVTLGARYQAAGCERLGFAPKITLRYKGGTRRSAFPALRAEVRGRPGDANIAGVAAALPPSSFLEQGHIRTICTRVQFAADACPKGSVYGFARAFTPLLDEPLEGPVYMRSNGDERELPDLVAALRGTFEFNLVGFIDSVDGRIRSRFVTAPDVPVTKFVLNMQGGKKGLIVNSTNICRRKQVARLRFTAHNGEVKSVRPVVKTPCKKGNGGKGKGKGKGGKGSQR